MTTATVSLEAPRLLVVEDDAALGEALCSALRNEDFQVHHARDAAKAVAAASTFRPDLALLDVALPGGRSGFDVAAALHAAGGVPMIFVTAADGLADRLRGFELGADDYLIKPFALPELLARVRAVLRRCGRLRSARIEVRDLVIDEDERTVTRGGTPIPLTPLELDLLLALARSPGQALSKPRLLARVWSYGDLNPNIVEVHISAVRRKLEAHGPRLIETVRNQGYRLRA